MRLTVLLARSQLMFGDMQATDVRVVQVAAREQENVRELMKTYCFFGAHKA